MQNDYQNILTIFWIKIMYVPSDSNALKYW